MGMDSATKAEGAVKTAVPPTAAAIHKVLDFFLRDQVVGYVLILPALILIASLIVYPFFYALWLSVSNAWVGSPGRFVGLANYLKLVNNNIFRQTLQNSLVFTGASVALKTVFGIGLALLLNKAVFLKRFIRGSILLPFVAPTALTTLGWWWMYEPMYSVFNWTLVHLGLIDKGLPWLSDPTLAMLAVISVNFWRGLPFFAITILAGLMAIPKELYEAAEVEWGQCARALLSHYPAAPETGARRGDSVLDHLYPGGLQHRLHSHPRGPHEYDASLRHPVL
jgi:multiple sugar transport system permease protein